MVLGCRIKELRKERHMSQEELGKLLGVTKVSISGYEKGIRVPSMEVMEKMLEVFNISADYLMGRELSAVCDGDESVSVMLALTDLEIIRELRRMPSLYNYIAAEPRRFFNSLYKKRI